MRFSFRRFGGWSLLLLPLALPFDAGCFCASGPSGPPAQETCDTTGMTAEGVTGVAVTSVERVMGVQGGMHTEIRFSAEGDVLPTCAEYVLRVDGATLSTGTIRGEVTGSSFASRAIIYFDPSGLGPPAGALTVEAFGLRSAPYGAPSDAGPPAADAP